MHAAINCGVSAFGKGGNGKAVKPDPGRARTPDDLADRLILALVNESVAVLREGREGTREGLAAAFARWPQNRAEIVEKQVIGDYVLFREHVTRGPATDGSELVEPFDVVAVYSFEGDKCSRVEFIR